MFITSLTPDGNVCLSTYYLQDLIAKALFVQAGPVVYHINPSLKFKTFHLIKSMLITDCGWTLLLLGLQ
jgi:hypothetical protein